MLSTPEPLRPDHDMAGFDCGEDTLNVWLRRRASANQSSGASRTYVVCQGRAVVGYYALSSGGVVPAEATGRFRRNMPDPVPVVILGRLAVSQSHRGIGLGRALFQDAASRVVDAAEIVGIRGLLVHALSEQAKAFYLRLGLESSPLEPMTLMATVADLKAAMTP